MAENKMGQNLQAGAEFFAKRFQKSLNRAQEKVLQKLGKSMETKDEQFEICFQNLNKQQTDGSRLFKDVKAYHAAVKAVHETSKRLSQTLRDTYEADWSGVEDLAVITESEDLLWNDFEEKVNDQIIRTMENYTSQFPEVKERVAKRGRKLVDYDSARHHLETLQSAKKKDEAKIAKAEEEFNKAQSVFEEINSELREELPVLHQSRIGCYVTVFQNISNLRDVFYKEMSVLNRELYNVMKKLETQHSGKAFIIKGLNSTSGKSKKKKSLVISNPIPCNTAFPADHVSILSSSRQNGKEAMPTSPAQRSESVSEETSQPEEGSISSKDVNSSESDLSSSGTNTPQRQSMSDNESNSDTEQTPEKAEEKEEEKKEEEEEDEDEGVAEAESDSETEAEAELAKTKSDDSVLEVPKSEGVFEDESNDSPPTPERETVDDPASSKPAPVPAPRLSSSERPARIKADQQEETKDAPVDQEVDGKGDDSTSHNPPGFMYKGVAVESHEASSEGLLQFEEGDIILVLSTSEEGMVKGVREEIWKQHADVESHCGIFSEKLIRPVEEE